MFSQKMKVITIKKINKKYIIISNKLNYLYYF